jgi:gamma-glutamylcyclotransferase (GGCT)/AIG2-like uncharacterized protein YtfP
VVKEEIPTSPDESSSPAGSHKLLFVYGTLLRRSRHPMARALADRARYVGPAKARGRLYDLGRFPGLVEPQAEGDWVHGDLYDLGRASPSTLAELDAYEQDESPLPAFFERRLGEAMLADDTRVPAWVYWYRGEVSEGQRIASGRYEKNCVDQG